MLPFCKPKFISFSGKKAVTTSYVYNSKRDKYDTTDSLLNKIKYLTKKKHYIWHRNSKADRGVIEQIFKLKDYNMREFKRYSDIMEKYHLIINSGKKPLIIDCGANIGVSVIYWKLMFSQAAVIAIEPERENIEILKQNTKNFDVIVLESAVASSSGVSYLFDPGAGEWGYRVAKEEKGAEVTTHSINDILSTIDFSFEPFIIKIDIEGGEGDLFSKNYHWFNEFYVGIIELHDWLLPKAKTSLPFLKMVSQLDRDFIYRNENIFSIKNS